MSRTAVAPSVSRRTLKRSAVVAIGVRLCPRRPEQRRRRPRAADHRKTFHGDRTRCFVARPPVAGPRYRPYNGPVEGCGAGRWALSPTKPPGSPAGTRGWAEGLPEAGRVKLGRRRNGRAS